LAFLAALHSCAFTHRSLPFHLPVQPGKQKSNDKSNNMSNTIVLKVAMMCGGCSGAVERVIGKMEGT
jgi:hypothetical protein